MRTLQSPEIYRNMGFWNEATQQGLLDTHVSVGGTGGAGYILAVELARLGVQNFSIADPEAFDRENANRVPGANSETIGRNKAEVFAEEVHKINEDAQVRVYKEGVNTDNLEEFMHDADIVLDATELSMPHLGTMIARESRRLSRLDGHHAVPVINVEYIAHAGQVSVYDPFSKHTFERRMGIAGGESAPLDEVAEQTLSPSRYLAYLPPYGDLETLMAVQNGASLPSNAIGAGQAAQLGAAETLKLVRHKISEKSLSPTYCPEVRWTDAYTGESGRTRHAQLSYYRHLAVMLVRNQLGLNEEASYTDEERAARGDGVTEAVTV